jgi:hypothetical protein
VRPSCRKKMRWPTPQVEVFKDTVTAYFRPSRTLYTFARFTTERDIAEFGPVSPGPVVQHASRGAGTRNYDAAEVLAMAVRLATGAVARPDNDNQ